MVYPKEECLIKVAHRYNLGAINEMMMIEEYNDMMVTCGIITMMHILIHLMHAYRWYNMIDK